MNVTVYPHTHWDREWYMPFESFRMRLIEVFDNIIEQLQSDKLKSFYFDGQTVFLEDYLEIYPEKRNLIKKLIKEKKLFIGPFYVLADEFLVSGESLIRNIEKGLKISNDFGCKDFIGYLPDSFGHNDCMPYILKGFGINNTVVWRGVDSSDASFIWQGFQDESIKTHFLPLGYFHDSLETKEIEKTLKKLKPYYKDNILLPIGADHLNLIDNFEDRIKSLDIKGFDIKSGSVFKAIKEQKPKETIKGELASNAKSFILKGVYSSRIYLKQQNILTSHKLNHIAEPLQVLSEIAGFTTHRKNEIEHAWKELLKNHPHDSICGCSHDEVHNEMETRFKKVNQICDYTISKCLFDISKSYKKDNIIAINPTGAIYKGVIEIETDKKLPELLNAQKTDDIYKAPDNITFDSHKIALSENFKTFNKYLINVKNLEPFSINKLEEKHIMPVDKELKATNNLIENSNLKIIIKNDNIWIQNKKSGEVFKNIFEIQDIGDFGDSYNFSYIKKDKPIIAEIIGTRISSNGSIQKSLEILHEIKIPNCAISNKKRNKEAIIHTVKTSITLNGLDNKAVFKTSFKNKSQDHLLRIKINFKNEIKQMFFENNFGLIKRKFDPKTPVIKDIEAKKDKELKENSVCFQRFLWNENLGVITKGVQEANVERNSLYLTLVRCTGQISKPDILTRGTPAGPPVYTPDGQIKREIELEYAFCFTKTPQELFKITNSFYNPTVTTIGKSNESKPNFKLLNNFKNNYTYALKHSKDNNSYVLRVLNLDNKEKKIEISKDFKVEKVKLNEEKIVASNILEAKKLESFRLIKK